MSHYAKLEQYHQSIRKQELRSIFEQKRIRMMENLENEEIEQENNFSQITDAKLMRIAQLCQTEQGVEFIYNLRIENQLQKYLKPEYINTQSQNYVSSIICNLYVISRPNAPSEQFTEDVFTLLTEGSRTTASNCVTLIFNIANDHAQWKQKSVQNHQLCFLLCKQLEKEPSSRLDIINALRTMVKIIQKSTPHDSFRKFFPKLITFLSNPTFNDNDIVGHAYFCYYHLSLMYPQESISYMIKQNLLCKFLRIAPLLMETKFTIITLRIIQIMLKNLNLNQIKQKVFPYLQNIMLNGSQSGSKNVKLSIYQIVIRALQQAKISALELMGYKIGYILLDHFSQEEDSQVLHTLVYLFSIVIMNIELSPLAQNLERLFQRVQLICPQEIQIIGFIKETQLKARQRAESYF